MVREQLFILILRFQSEDAQQYAAMWVGETMRGSAGKIPLKLLCVGFYNLSISKSNGCNIHSNWLSLFSPEMKEFLRSWLICTLVKD